jgi:hypothetical protein
MQYEPSGMKSLASMLPPHWPDAVRAVLTQYALLDGIFPHQTPMRAWDPATIRAIHLALPGWEQPHSKQRGLLHGLLFYALDALDEAHTLFQEIDSFLGAYGHGMMHRREGDFFNANYWFRHAGKPPAGVFAPEFNPVELTASCQRAATAPLAEQERTVEALRREWMSAVDALLAGKIR